MRPAAFRRKLCDALAGHLRSGRPPRNVPEGGTEFWNVFMRINATRVYGANGPLAISYQEIEAWTRLYRWPLQPQHIDIIRAMDEAWLAHHYSKTAVPTMGRSSGQSINPAAFDAVFG